MPEGSAEITESIDRYRQLAVTDRDAALPGRAALVTTLATELAQAGRGGETLSAAQEVAALYDEPATNPYAYLREQLAAQDLAEHLEDPRASTPEVRQREGEVVPPGSPSR